jgi:transmembrane sensor
MAQEHLILRFLEGTMSEQERREFEQWLGESEDNRKMAEELQRVWQLGELKGTNFDSSNEWIRLQKALRKNPETSVRAIYPRIFLRAAAVVLLLLLSLFVIYLAFFKTATINYETADNTMTITLPDGSSVLLNKNSRVVYKDDFRTERSMKLEGEGFFDVKHDPAKPFTIAASGAMITVLGTSFNVKAENARTEVFVVTGKVRLTDIADHEKNLVLTAGISGTFDEGRRVMLKDSAEDANVLAWKNRQLVFRKTPMSKVLRTLSMYFKKDLRAGNQSILGCRFTGAFDDPTLEEVIETLHEALDLKVEVDGNSYVFEGEGCKQN